MKRARRVAIDAPICGARALGGDVMTSGNGASIGVGGQQKPSAFPPRDPDAVRTHVEMLHQLAAPLTGRRKLIVATYGEDPLKGKEIVSKVCQFPIGDVEPMVKAIINLNTERHRNVYCPWAVMRKDLPSGKKGSEQDIVWLMGLVSDFDDDDAANWSHRLPCPPNYVLETSAGRFQTFYIVDKPSSVTGAKRVAEKLKAFAHCDHGSADLSHVWRVPGTLNWPNAKKVKEGRPREPQVVRVLQPWDGALTRFARLADFVDLIPEPPNGGLGFKPPNGHAPNPDRGEPQQGIAEIIGKLPKWLLGRLKKNGEGVDRSKELFSVIAKLCELGHDDTTITKILAEFPDGIVAKYRNRAADLNKEITRIREKSQKKTTEPEGDYIENDKGKRLACLANAIIALRTSPEWQTKLRYDLFAERLLYGSKPWETINDIFLAEWLQHRGIMVSPQIAGQAAYAVGFNNQFHPVRDYLEGLSWDQTERLDNWLRAYFGVKCSVVEPGNDETVQRVIAEQGYHAAVGAKFLIGMVARVMRPGCKFDCAYVLEGEQGALKSTALRELMPCEDWFTDELADLGSKDAALQLAGRWLVEWSELDTYGRSEISRVKAHMSRQADKFRPPYGAHVITRPRQCGFAGSTNQSEYLRDETRGRRF